VKKQTKKAMVVISEITKAHIEVDWPIPINDDAVDMHINSLDNSLKNSVKCSGYVRFKIVITAKVNPHICTQ
jgi:hypothetical protein